MATLRPLFRNFFARTQLTGDSVIPRVSNAWSNLNNGSQGYNRSGSNPKIDAFAMTSKMQTIPDTTTTIGSGMDLERQENKSDEYTTSNQAGTGDKISHSGAYNWGTSETKLTGITYDNKKPP